MKKQFLQAFLSGSILLVISIVFQLLIKLFVDGLSAKLSAENYARITPIAGYLILILLILCFIMIFVVALQLGSTSYPIKNVVEPIGYSFKRWHRILGIPHLWSQFRLTIASGILIIAIIIFHVINPQANFLHYLLIFIVATDIILQFYVATADIRNTLHRSIVQLLFTLGQQIEISLTEALSKKPTRLRIGIFLYNQNDDKLYIKYHYNMDGEPDLELGVGIKQGVEGRVFTEGRPYLLDPYKTDDLGFNPEQIGKIPTSIKWKMGIPLLCNHTPFGVISVDCDMHVKSEWLDKILDFTHAMTTSISILISQFPSKEIQMSFRN